MGGIVHEVLFNLMNCGKETIILRMPWLDKENPITDWKGKIVEIRRTTDHTTSLNNAYTTAQGFLINGIEGPTYPELLPQDLKGKTLSTLMKISWITYKKPPLCSFKAWTYSQKSVDDSPQLSLYHHLTCPRNHQGRSTVSGQVVGHSVFSEHSRV